MDNVRDYFKDQACCEGHHFHNVVKTLPFAALGLFGGPIGLALGMFSMAASGIDRLGSS